MLKVDPVETLARRNCESILARYAAESTALTLSPAGRSRYSPATGRFKCKICGKMFATFQALGGHTSSHSKDSFTAREVVGAKAVPVRRLKVHECSKCRVRFPTGQALGGHMRRHFDLSAKRKRDEYDGEIEEKKIKTVPFLEVIVKEEVKIETVPFSCAEDKKGILLFDLNSPPVDEDSRNEFLKLV